MIVLRSCALLGYEAASIGNFLPTIWENLSFPFSGFKNPKESLLLQYRVYIGKRCGQ